MKKIQQQLTAAVLACGLFGGISSAAYAGSDSGIYIGGSLGSASIDYEDTNFEFDESDTGYKIFTGYNFGLVPTLNIAAEVAYVDFGEQETEVASFTDVSANFDTLTLTGIVGFDTGPIGLFGKLGFASWDGDVSALSDSVSTSDSGTDPVYGIGAKVQLGSLAVRTEYEIFDTEDADVSFFSVGAVLTF